MDKGTGRKMLYDIWCQQVPHPRWRLSTIILSVRPIWQFLHSASAHNVELQVRCTVASGRNPNLSKGYSDLKCMRDWEQRRLSMLH